MKAERIYMMHIMLPIISKQEAYSIAQEELESARRKAEKQNKLLKRWFWVPGYGAYLAFDKLLNDQEADTAAAYREYCASKERLAAISRDLESAKYDYQCSQTKIMYKSHMMIR